MTRAEMIEAVARALAEMGGDYLPDLEADDQLAFHAQAGHLLAVLRPLVLEEAAAVCEDRKMRAAFVALGPRCLQEAADRIRALAKIA